MRSRSRKAAWALLVGAVAGIGSVALAAGPPVENAVELDLQIDGIGPAGAKIEIKPGHPACQFKPVVRSIEPEKVQSRHRLETIKLKAKSTSADRDCSFEITIKEPGLPVKTIRRGLILSQVTAGQPIPKQTARWVINSPTMAARDEKEKSRR